MTNFNTNIDSSNYKRAYTADESSILEMVRQGYSSQQILQRYPSAENHLDEVEAYRQYLYFDPNRHFEDLMQED